MTERQTETKPHDWSSILATEARLSDVITVDRLAARYAVPLGSVRRALSRLGKRGLVARVAKGVYLNRLVRDQSPRDFISVLKPNSYISLESALSEWGLSTQTPVVLTCVTTDKPREYRTPEFAITFRTISRSL